MKFEQPNAEDKRWREAVGDWGVSILSKYRPIQIHHVIGRTAKIKGVGNIGHKFILPLCKEEHLWCDWGNEGLRLMKERVIHGHGEKLRDDIEDLSFLELQKYLFKILCRHVRPNFEQDVYDAILAYHR